MPWFAVTFVFAVARPKDQGFKAPAMANPQTKAKDAPIKY
jgi:hypothetical protein